MRIRLGADDRERLGVTSEWLVYNDKRMSVKEAIRLQKLTGLDLGKMTGVEATLFMVWRALEQNSVRVKFQDLDFEMTELDIEDESQDESEDELGKP